MEEKIFNISFNIWAKDAEEVNRMKGSIIDFINWFGERGYKVSADKVSEAINGWQKNFFIKNEVIKYFTK